MKIPLASPSLPPGEGLDSRGRCTGMGMPTDRGMENIHRKD